MRVETLSDLLKRFPSYDNPTGFEQLPPESMEFLIRHARDCALIENFEQAKATLDLARVRMKALPPSEQQLYEIRIELEEGRQLLLNRRPTKATLNFMRVLEMSESPAARFFSIEAAVLIAMAQPQKNRNQWLRHAVQLTENSVDISVRPWRAHLHLLCGWEAFDSRHFDDCLGEFQSAVSLFSVTPESRNSTIGRWSCGRALRALLQGEAALKLQQQLQMDLAAYGESSAHIDLEIGECLLLLERGEEAKSHFSTAHQKLSKDPYYADNHDLNLQRMWRLSKGK